jgi:hypothetical protein
LGSAAILEGGRDRTESARGGGVAAWPLDNAKLVTPLVVLSFVMFAPTDNLTDVVNFQV